MTNINKIFDNMESLTCRDIDYHGTMILLHSPDPNVFYSWGVSEKINYNDRGIILKVSGHHFQGYLLISLSFLDLFDVYLFEDGKIKKSIKDLYFDQLVEAIDKEIEYIEDYN